MHKVMTAGDHVRHIRGGSVMLVERVARPADGSGTAWTCWRDGGEIKCAAYPVVDLVQVPPPGFEMQVDDELLGDAVSARR
jgi:hypothetical protein